MACLRPALVWLLCCMAQGVLAANPPANTSPSQRPAAQQAAVADLGLAVSVDALRQYSGSGLVQNNQTITGTVTGNSATNVSTGGNSITGNVFSAASGLPSVIQNTGNNVLIQNGVSVNVQLKP